MKNRLIFLIGVFLTSLSGYSQDGLSSVGQYNEIPINTTLKHSDPCFYYNSAFMSKRYSELKIKMLISFKVSRHGDTSVVDSAIFFRNGYKKFNFRNGKELSPGKIYHSAKQRDSVLNLCLEIKSKEVPLIDTIINGKNGFCNEDSYYNSNGQLVKVVICCGRGLHSNTKYEYKYDNEGRLSQTIRYDGRGPRRLKRNWSVGFNYDENGLLTEKLYLDKKDKVISKKIYLYEYWGEF